MHNAVKDTNTATSESRPPNPAQMAARGHLSGPGFIADPAAVRQTVLDMLLRSGGAHLGSSMSSIEMLCAMYAFVDLEKIRSHAPDRSRIIMSKGHAAGAVYAVLAHYGLIDFQILSEYLKDGSHLVGLVGHRVPCVEHSTGSLGHGLGVGAGAAVALRNLGYHDSSVLVLCGDSEMQEGSNWEALMFIKHHKLTNLVTLIDDNGIGNVTQTRKVLDMQPMADKFRGFGFATMEVDGHDAATILAAIKQVRGGDVPGVIWCKTTKGKGVPFAEDEPIWHYRTLNEKLFAEASDHLKMQKKI